MRPSATSDTVLEVSDLHVRFGGVQAVADVSLVLHEREIVGLIGPNGAGKTTLFDLISGFTPADGGRIALHGSDISEPVRAGPRAAAGSVARSRAPGCSPS